MERGCLIKSYGKTVRNERKAGVGIYRLSDENSRNGGKKEKGKEWKRGKWTHREGSEGRKKRRGGRHQWQPSPSSVHRG